MTNDVDWLEDVRRWYFNGGNASVRAVGRREPVRKPVAVDDRADLGYEAAAPTTPPFDRSSNSAAGSTEYC